MNILTNKPIIIIGNGGHAHVLTELLLLNNQHILGYTAPLKTSNKFNLTYLGDDTSINDYNPEEVHLVLGIGSTDLENKRKYIYLEFKRKGYHFPNCIHPRAIISPTAELQNGIQIMSGSIIQTFVKVGENTIINTGAQIDHDCNIGNHCHIAPGAILSGNISIGDSVHVGTGAKIIQSLKVGNECLIGAGAVVINNIPNHSKVKGIPAKEVK